MVKIAELVNAAQIKLYVYFWFAHCECKYVLYLTCLAPTSIISTSTTACVWFSAITAIRTRRVANRWKRKGGWLNKLNIWIFKMVKELRMSLLQKDIACFFSTLWLFIWGGGGGVHEYQLTCLTSTSIVPFWTTACIWFGAISAIRTWRVANGWKEEEE